jgi:thioredoxin 1
MNVEKLDGLPALDEFLKNNPKAVIDFWAPWCGPCRMLADVIAKEDEKDYNGAVFGKINIEDHRDAGEKFGIMSIPCLIVFKDGEEKGRIIGLKRGPDLQEEVKKLL